MEGCKFANTMSLDTCRICLSGHTKMFNLVDTPLEELYERITLIPLDDMDRMPLVACYVCHHMLYRIKCFIDKAVQADDFLRQALYLQSENRNNPHSMFDVTSLKSLHVSPTRYNSYNPDDVAEGVSKSEGRDDDDIKMNYDVVGFAVHPLQALETFLGSSKSVHDESAKTSAAEITTEMEAGRLQVLEGPLQCLRAPLLQKTGVTILKQREDTKTDVLKPPEDTLKSIPEKTTFNCTQCTKVFSTKLKLIYHIGTHKRSKRQRCNFCPKGFVHESDLKRHLRTHTKERPYPCTQCKKSFRLKSTLGRHILTHADVKPFSCSFCDKAFTTNSSLTDHMTLHTGELRFHCNQCGASFGRRRTFARHVEKHKVKIELID